MAKHFLLILHSSYNQNHQSQWSRVQTHHYRDEKSHRVNLGKNNIFVFCSHMEPHKKIWATQTSADGKTAGLKKTKYVFKKGRQCRPCTTFTTEPPNCTVHYWHETPTGNNTWKYKHVTEHSWGKKLWLKSQTVSWYHWTMTDKSKDLQC